MERADHTPGSGAEASQSPGAAIPGTVLDARYRLEGELGAGGMGVVYRAQHLRLRRQVAIKMLRQPFAGTQDLRPRFEREAHALAALSHPNIVTVTDYGVHEGRPYLAMELVEGRTLRSVIDEGPLAPGRAVEIALQLLEGVAFAHRRGLVHRDLKPSNVLLSPLERGRELVKILDFGFAKFLEGDPTDQNNLTRSAIGFGTPAYIPPEQATGGSTDARTDVYSLGVVLFELLTGAQPFQGELGELVHQHLAAPVPRLLDLRSGLPRVEELQRIVDRAMEKRQDDRFADAVEMLAALRRVDLSEPRAVDVHGRTLAAGPPRAPTEPPPRRRRGGGRWVLSLVAVGGAAAAAYVLGPDLFHSGKQAAAELAGAALADPGPAGREPGDAPVAAPEAVEPLPVEAPVEPGLEEAAPEEAALEEAAPEEAAPEEAAPEEAAPEEAAPEEEPAAEAEPPAADARAESALGEAPDGLAEPAPVAVAEAPAPPESPVEAAPPVDPWSVRPLPREIARLRRHVYGGRRITDDTIRRLRAVARDNRGDPRPSLLLAHAYIRRGWMSDAVERYALAYQMTPDARHDPRMLRNLLRIVATEAQVAGPAADAVARMYGAEALEAIDGALAARGLDDAGRRRLEALRVRSARGR